MNKEYPKLELIPGVTLDDIKEKKEPKNKLDPETMKEINKLQKKISVNSKGKKFFRRNSQIPSLSIGFLSTFALVNEKSTIKEEEKSEDSEPSLNESLTKEEKIKEPIVDQVDPFFVHKSNLSYKIESLRQAQIEVKEKFKKDCEAYKAKIKSLEDKLNSEFDENELDSLQKINKRNKEFIKELEKQIEEKEKIKNQEKNYYNEKLNETVRLKYQLIKEINELEILAKEVNKSKLDYDDPIELVKLNFDDGVNRSKNYHQNNYNSDDFYEGLSEDVSFTKNHQITMSNTEKYFFNTKNFIDSPDTSMNEQQRKDLSKGEESNKETSRDLMTGRSGKSGQERPSPLLRRGKPSSQPLLRNKGNINRETSFGRDESMVSKDMMLIRDPTADSEFF